MNRHVYKTKRFNRRQKSVRKNISGTKDTPRVALTRSNKHMFVQAVDDVNHKTLASAGDVKATAKGTKSEKATNIGKELGEKLKKLKVKSIVFDRSGYKYHGRVKALAEGIREAGIKF